MDCQGSLTKCRGRRGWGFGESLRARKSHHPDFNEVILLILVASFIAGCWYWPILGSHNRGGIHTFRRESWFRKSSPKIYEQRSAKERTLCGRENCRTCRETTDAEEMITCGRNSSEWLVEGEVIHVTHREFSPSVHFCQIENCYRNSQITRRCNV